MESFIKEFEHLKVGLKEIKSATNNFETNIIGSGGFGPVYRGKLSHSKGHSMVAIKRLDSRKGQGDREFWKEITTLTSRTHENLISLLGFCDEGGEKILVYEYASNGSLDRHLGSTDFTWTQRLKTCLDVARVISYLHDAKSDEERILHRDIKSSNILLDANWNAKLSDMGLSKAVSNAGYITDVAGTPEYCDPLYRGTGFLTERVDVYPFGLLLLEVLCGKLCYDKTRSLVPTWKQSYEEKKLQNIIFDDLKQKIDEKSLETYSNIAFKCLQKSSEEQPTIPDVVKELEKAHTYQELYERLILPEDYKQMLMITAEDPMNDMPETELKMLLLKGTLLNRGKTWLSLNMDGDRCEMISIAECLTSTESGSPRYIRSSEYKSRFEVGCYEPFGEEFKTHVQTEFLSPQIMYTVNLVFQRKKSKERYIGLEYKLKGRKGKSYSFVSDEREDGRLTAELYQFTSDQKTVELEILFYTKYCKDILVEGIEFQPLKNVEHEMLRDENVDMQSKKDLREGVVIKHFGEERFPFAKDGKKCLMLPAIAVLNEKKWEWKSLPDTRFEQVAVADCIIETFGIFCKFSSEMLSPKTTYAVFLVYELPKGYNDINPPVQVVDENSDSEQTYNIFLRTLQTPLIIWNEKEEKTFNPSCTPKIKGLPKMWSSKWMEVQVDEFQTRSTIKMISTRLRFSSKDKALNKGITVLGLEYRPI